MIVIYFSKEEIYNFVSAVDMEISSNGVVDRYSLGDAWKDIESTVGSWSENQVQSFMTDVESAAKKYSNRFKELDDFDRNDKDDFESYQSAIEELSYDIADDLEQYVK